MKEKKENYSEKELALYQAVIDLIEEDADIHSIKVSDITARAGIGKGTAYEYFSSKEEMISKAIIWSGDRQFQKISSILEGKGSLQEQIMAVLDFIEQDMWGKRCSEQLLKLQNHSCEIKEDIYREFARSGGPGKRAEDILNILMEQGRKEGSIHEMLPDAYVFMVFMPGFISYFIYLMKQIHAEDIPPQQTKNFICNNMMRALKEPLFS